MIAQPHLHRGWEARRLESLDAKKLFLSFQASRLSSFQRFEQVTNN